MAAVVHQPLPRPATAAVKEAFKNAFTAHDTQTTRQRVECKSNARNDRQPYTLFPGFAGEMITESKYINIF